MGVYGNPTTVNNVESIAVVPEILRRGGAWFAGFGRPNNTGTKLFMVSGHVNKPAVFEDALGCTFEELIEKHCGGIRGGWDNLLAVIPRRRLVPGACVAKTCAPRSWILTACARRRASFGTGGMIVMDKSTDIIQAIWRIAASSSTRAAASARRAAKAPAG